MTGHVSRGFRWGNCARCVDLHRVARTYQRVPMSDSVIREQAGVLWVSSLCAFAYLDPRVRGDDGFAYSFPNVGRVGQIISFARGNPAISSVCAFAFPVTPVRGDVEYAISFCTLGVVEYVARRPRMNDCSGYRHTSGVRELSTGTQAGGARFGALARGAS